MLDFDQIMAPLGAQVFLRDYWLKQFVHIRGKAGRFTSLLTWDELNGMLQQHRLTPPRLKLYKDGQPLDPSQYLTPAMFGVPRVDAGRLVLSLAQGASLILDDVQEMAPHVRDKEEYVDLYEIKDSDKAYEQGVQVTPFGLAPIKPQGDAVTYDSEIQGPVTTYTHIAYALGYQVTIEEIRDNLYPEVASRRAAGNAFSMRQTVENAAAFIYNNAFSSTYFTTADGVALCSTAHTNTTGGTFSNALSPAADLSESSIEDLTIQIMGAQNDTGLLINVMPKSLHIARQEWYNASRILDSVLQPNTANNNINVLKAQNVFPEGIKMNHYFTAPHAWFIRTNVPEGMTFFWRDRPDFDQDNDFPTKNALASSYMRFSMGCTDPRGIFGANGP